MEILKHKSPVSVVETGIITLHAFSTISNTVSDENSEVSQGFTILGRYTTSTHVGSWIFNGFWTKRPINCTKSWPWAKCFSRPQYLDQQKTEGMKETDLLRVANLSYASLPSYEVKKIIPAVMDAVPLQRITGVFSQLRKLPIFVVIWCDKRTYVQTRSILCQVERTEA